MKRKVFLILVFVLALFIFPRIANAEGVELYIGDGTNTYNILDGEIPDGVSYDSSSQTITLNDFHGEYITIINMDATIVLNGENTLGNSGDSLLNLVGAKFTIKGNGSLDIDVNAENDPGVYLLGTLNIDGGEITIHDSKALGIYADGNIVVNGGKLNIKDCKGGIMTAPNAIEENGDFIANGGKVTFENCSDGALILSGTFKLNGSDILIKNSVLGIFASSDEPARGVLEFNDGNLIFKDMPSGSIAFLLAYDYYDVDRDNLLVFDSDNLYIDNEDCDFRFVDAESEGILYVTLAEEGITIDDFDGEGVSKFASNVSILSKNSQEDDLDNEYEIIEGDKQKIKDKAEKIKIDADLDKFVALYINDELVNEENYELEEGSTIIKLKDEYIKKLSAGTYKFKAVFNDGTAEGTFEITGDNPNTSDNIIISIIMLVIASVGIVFFRRQLKSM